MAAPRYFIRFRKSYVELTEAGITVGRGVGCDVVLADDSASREHCRIFLEEGAARVIDLGSRNGVRVNGEPIDEATALYHGDVVTVGASHLSLHRRRRPPTGASLPRFTGDIDNESTTGGASPLRMFADGAAESLQTGDLLVAEVSVRNLVRSLRSLASRGRRPNPELGLRAMKLAIELADASGHRAWLDEADSVADALGLDVPSTVQARRGEVEARLASS